jgi:hypothetical protein
MHPPEKKILSAKKLMVCFAKALFPTPAVPVREQIYESLLKKKLSIKFCTSDCIPTILGLGGKFQRRACSFSNLGVPG